METNKNPIICTFLIIIAWLNFLSGLIAGISFITSQQVTMGIGFIIGGVFGAVIFWAISEVIIYLDNIDMQLYALNKEKPISVIKSNEETISDNEWKCRCNKINPKEFSTCPKCGRSFDAIV